MAAEAKKYNEQYQASPTVALSIQTTQEMLAQYTLYSNPSFAGSYEMRDLFDHSMLQRLATDLEIIGQGVQAGMPKTQAVGERAGEDCFQEWYTGLLKQADEALGR